MQRRNQHIERVGDRLAVILFLIAITLPGALTLSRSLRGPDLGDPVTGEMRSLAPLPPLPSDTDAMQRFPGAFDRWYSDAFGLRERLVRWHNVLYWFGLGKTGSDKVVRGKGDWIFYRERRVLEATLGAIPLTPAELEGWRATFEARRDWCEERGIQYIFVSAPAKAQIYPEYLPDDWQPVGPNRLDQVHEHLDQNSTVRHVDLRLALLAEKARGDRIEEQDWLYFPLGTHWASRGSVVAYCEILRALSEGVLAGTPIPGPEDFQQRLGGGSGDSWAERLYLDGLLDQAAWILRSQAPILKPSPIPLVRMAQRFEQPGAPDLPKLLLYHDSFATHVIPELSQHFSSVSCYWTTTWQTALMIGEDPDVVVDFMVERMLLLETPERILLDDQERLRALFVAGTDEWVIDPLAEDPELRVVGDHRVREQGASLVLRRAGGWPLFDLHELRAPPGFDLILELDLEAPEAVTLEFVYPGPDRSPGYKRINGTRVHLERGRQTVYVLLEHDRLDVATSPVVRVGARPGARRWVVNGIRVRQTASPRE